ncbi:Ti-type conjugative transfer relaxase TraA [Burkholderia stagnalis]
MAVYHLSVKYGKKGQAGKHNRYIGRDGHYAYIAREGKFEERDDLMLSESGNMPAWAKADASLFWDAADQYEGENRKTYVELEISLPRELSSEQQVELVREFTRNTLGDRHAYTWAIHRPAASDGLEQPHFHLMFTERINDGIARDPQQFFKRYNRAHPEKGGALKDAYFRHPKFVREIREEWSATANHFMSRYGIEARIDHRSYRAQGIELEPSRKVGIATHAGERGVMEAVLAENRVRASRNGERLLINPAIAIHALTATQSVFSRRDVEQFVFRHTDGEEQFRQVYARIMNSKELLALRDPAREGEWFTSAELKAIEGRLVDRARSMSHADSGLVGDRAIREKLRAERKFNAGQRKAFSAMSGAAQLVVVNGAAGTGKSYVMKAAREALEADGMRVLGAALQGKTADDMQHDAGVESRTLHSLLDALAKGSVQLDAKTVVIVDEAGMVGSRQLEKLLDQAQAAGARVRLIGDAWQLHAVDAGDAFRAVSREADAAGRLVGLTEIKRQDAEWQRAASAALSRHDVRSALSVYEANGDVVLERTTDDARDRLLACWRADQLTAPGESQILLAHTNGDRAALNAGVRDMLRTAGQLGADQTITIGDRKIALAVGDRILFGQNEYVMGVKNGTLGTVEEIKVGRSGVTAGTALLHVRLDNGWRVEVDTGRYAQLDHGYALTIHKSQGVTVDRAYVLATKSMQAELAYVAMTRHRIALTMIGGRDQFADRDALARSLSRGESKAFSGYGEEQARDVEHGVRHSIAMRREIHYAPVRKEKTLAQAVGQYANAWIADQDARQIREAPLAKHRAALRRSGIDLARFDTQIQRDLDQLLGAHVHDDRAWRALVELSGPARAKMLVGEVAKARAEGRTVDAQLFRQPEASSVSSSGWSERQREQREREIDRYVQAWHHLQAYRSSGQRYAPTWTPELTESGLRLNNLWPGAEGHLLHAIRHDLVVQQLINQPSSAARTKALSEVIERGMAAERGSAVDAGRRELGRAHFRNLAPDEKRARRAQFLNHLREHAGQPRRDQERAHGRAKGSRRSRDKGGYGFD